MFLMSFSCKNLHGVSGKMAANFPINYERSAFPMKKIVYGALLLFLMYHLSPFFFWNKEVVKVEDEKITLKYFGTYSFQQLANGRAGKLPQNTIFFNDRAVQYVDGGMENGTEIIFLTDYASTWGGVNFRGDDNLNTHFIGNNKRQFKGIQNANNILITDSFGQPFLYEVKERFIVDLKGTSVTDKYSYYDYIVSPGFVEKVIFQTSVAKNYEWILVAKPVESGTFRKMLTYLIY